jgi:hypothetical protein
LTIDPRGNVYTVSRRHDADGTSHGVVRSPSTRPIVIGRHVFYDNSVFDGNEAGVGTGNGAAVATDKQAQRAGQPATFANCTSYSRGINGVMVDIARLPADVSNLSAADFSFRVSDPAAAGVWAAGPAPSGVVLRRGAGDGGSDRVELFWPDGAIVNRWLQVTVKANANTGLAAPDVFSFGNLVGDTGSGASALSVNTLDFVAVRRKLFTLSSIMGRFDFDRDGRVTAADLLLVRANYQRSLPLLGAPAVAACAFAPIAPAADRALPASRSFYTSLLSSREYGDGGPGGSGVAR